MRQAVGDDYRLMLDCTWSYRYDQALRVGRAIEALGFYWYEDPLADDDLFGCMRLREKLDIPLMATEYSPGGFTNYVPWILNRATDYLRGDVAVKGGITALIKTAHLAEAFGLNFEVHHGGNSLNNVANLHVIMAIRNARFRGPAAGGGAEIPPDPGPRGRRRRSRPRAGRPRPRRRDRLQADRAQEAGRAHLSHATAGPRSEPLAPGRVALASAGARAARIANDAEELRMTGLRLGLALMLAPLALTIAGCDDEGPPKRPAEGVDRRPRTPAGRSAMLPKRPVMRPERGRRGQEAERVATGSPASADPRTRLHARPLAAQPRSAA